MRWPFYRSNMSFIQGNEHDCLSLGAGSNRGSLASSQLTLLVWPRIVEGIFLGEPQVETGGPPYEYDAHTTAG